MPARAEAGALRIGGITPFTTIDFPGRLAAVVFCQGCPWRCGYCHNTELLDARAPTRPGWGEVLQLLHERQGLLDGVVFSGGEPTLQAALGAAVNTVRALGLKTALHTAGMYPERLATLLPRIDWVGFDVKGPSARYDVITATPGSGARAFESLALLLKSDVELECRTTWHAALFGVDELLALADDLRARGVREWALQECRAPGTPAWTLTDAQIERLGVGFERFTLRRA